MIMVKGLFFINDKIFVPGGAKTIVSPHKIILWSMLYESDRLLYNHSTTRMG